MSITLDLAPDRLAVARLDATAAIPAWVAGTFVSITRTTDELSIVAPEPAVPADQDAERGWRRLAVRGPLDFALVGILAQLATPLAEAGVPIFVVSTHDTDHVLVKDDRLDVAIRTLRAAGHRVREPHSG